MQSIDCSTALISAGADLTRRFRDRIETLAEAALELGRHETVGALIDLLDALDGDPDLEPDLGAPELRPGDLVGHQILDEARWRTPANDREEDGDELEPELGWSLHVPGGVQWPDANPDDGDPGPPADKLQAARDRYQGKHGVARLVLGQDGQVYRARRFPNGRLVIEGAGECRP